MRRDDPPHYYALEGFGGAYIVSETQGCIEYRGAMCFWVRDPNKIGTPFKSFAGAQRVVNELREADSQFFQKSKAI